jgi:acyl-CoA dehydrogenase
VQRDRRPTNEEAGVAAQRLQAMKDELSGFRDAVRRFVEAELAPHEARWGEQQHVDREAWLKAGAMGLLLADVPEAYGGAGATFAHECVVFEELQRANVTGFGKHVHSIVAHYLLAYGTEAQKARWLPKMAAGEMIAAVAMSEPGAGSDLQGVRTRAVRQGDAYVVDGSKTFISNGYLADLICLVVKTDPAAGSRGVSLLMVETANLPGFRCGRILDKVGMHGQDTAELYFDDVRVPAANLLGPAEGRGFYQLMEQLPWERTIVAVSAVAAIERAVELTVEYVKERKAFGKPLMEMQNTRFRLAECRTTAHVARVFLDDCIERVMDGTMDAATASMAKWWTTEWQCRVVDECLQLFGGYGYMMDYPIGKMYADARVQKIYGGTNEIMKELIARSL